MKNFVHNKKDFSMGVEFNKKLIEVTKYGDYVSKFTTATKEGEQWRMEDQQRSYNNKGKK